MLMFAGIKVGHWKLSNWKVVVQLLTKATLYVVDFFFLFNRSLNSIICIMKIGIMQECD